MNVVAPYLFTARLHTPTRHLYLSRDPAFRQRMLAALADATGVELPSR